ncbi:hypothetical protein SK128_026917 [Halocaridina rubra]|uniref:E3 ubiquitin-protein ligase listerin n=1 Tax=Halocaridina rubra TaxID=373956 RepID=A0AAN8XFH5_HALRR
MYSVLRDGGRGSGSELYPHLLPIISLVPEKAMEDKCNFYEEFFRALSNGICKDQVMTSSRDVSAGVKSLYECLLFVSSVNTDVKLWNTLVKYQMVELVRSSFTDKPQLSSSNLYREISQILRIWAWKCNFEESSRNLHDLIDLFWVSFLLVCEVILEVGNEVQLAKAVDFFLVLKTPTSKFSSRREGVKFSDEKLNCELPEGGKSKWSNKEKEKLFLEMTSSNLAPFTLMCYKCYQKDNNINVYNIFAILLSSFPSSRLYSALLYGAGEEKFVRELDVVQKLILPKLEEDSLAIINPSVNMFLSLYSLMEPREQETILKSLKQSLSIGALRLLVEKMTERRESDPVAAAWLLSSQLGSFLVQLIDILCCPERSKGAGSHSGQQDELISLFNFVLRNGNKKEPVISMDYVSEILMKMTLNLKAIDADTEPEDQMVQLVANLAGQLFSSYVCWQTNGIQEFMRSLFLLLCQSSKSLCGDTVEILKATFLKAFRGLITFTVENSPEKLLHEEGTVSIILKDIKQIVMEDSSTFGLTLTLSELVHHLFVVVYERVKGEEESSIMLDHRKIQTMLNILIPSENDWTEIENTLCPLYVAPAILQGTISFREFPFPRNMQEDLTWNQKHTRISLFLCELLLVLCHCEEYQTDDTKEEVYLGQYTCLAVVALHSTCHSTSMMDLLEASHNTCVSEDVKGGVTRLKEDMTKLLQIINQGNKRLITKQIRDRCSDGSSAWCVTLVKVLSTWIKAEDVNVSKLMDGLDENALGFTATKQSLIPLLSEATLMDLLDEEVTKLDSLSDDPFSATPSVALISTGLAYLLPRNTEHTINSVFSVLGQWRETADNIYLFAINTSSVAWEDIALTCSLVRLVTVIVKKHALHIQPQHWDFILCSIASWCQSLEESRKSIATETVVGTFSCAVCKCIGCVSEFMDKLPSLPEKDKFPPKLADDWKEFFSPSIYSPVIPIFVEVAGSYGKTPTVILYGVCRAICIGVYLSGPEELINHSLPVLYNALDAEADLKLPDSQQILLNHLTPLLTSFHHPTQFAVYSMIHTALPQIMEEWEKNKIDICDEEEDMPQRPLPYAITRVIDNCVDVVEAAIAERNMGDECILLPPTDAYVFTLAYLLAWKLSLKCITYASDANQHQYSSYLRQSNKLQVLLELLFKLMPQTPVIEEAGRKSTDEKSSPTMFNTQLNLEPGVTVTPNIISHLACKVYYDCVSQIPAAVRQWFIGLDRQCQSIVDVFTSTYVSPLLINQEMSAVSSSTTKFDNMMVKTRPGSREVIATYSIDEASMELILRMATNHPLSTIIVEDHKRVGVSVAQWRNWLLGLNTMLSHRNTPLLQSLAFWKQNVDQKFRGIEECFICYYVLHGTNHQLPKLLCRTCKKKFHAACLYKWFNSSNNSTCPLCRSLF